MTSLTKVIQNHIEYDAWAAKRVLDAASTLTAEQLARDFGTADKSVKGTLLHLFQSSRAWHGRVNKGAPAIPFALPEDQEWPALDAQWVHLLQDWKEWADALGEGDLLRLLEYTDRKGNPWSQPLWQIALHVVNHGTHHRGQISGFLRASGFTPPRLDFIAFARQQTK